MLIEKQAIFEVLLDTRTWGDKYITNPFPYINKDITTFKEEDLKHFKKHHFPYTMKNISKRKPKQYYNTSPSIDVNSK